MNDATKMGIIIGSSIVIGTAIPTAIKYAEAKKNNAAFNPKDVVPYAVGASIAAVSVFGLAGIAANTLPVEDVVTEIIQ